jgi:hypothetical protein
MDGAIRSFMEQTGCCAAAGNRLRGEFTQDIIEPAPPRPPQAIAA